MKILHIYELGPLGEDRIYGGLEISILELCKALSDRGHEVSILAGAGREGKTKKFFIGDVEVIPVDFRGIMRRTWDASTLRLSRQALFPFVVRNIEGYDVYHGHVYVSGLAAWMMAKRNRAVAVNTIHGSYYNVWEIIEPRLRAFFFKTVERIFVPILGRLVDLQIHTSRSFARQAMRWGVPKEKIRYIPNGVDLRVFRADASVKEGISKGRIFTARRLVKKNGLDCLIRSLSYLTGSSLDFHLYIAGEGPERKALERLSETLGVQDKVTFMGPLSHKEVAEQLAKAEIAVIPSLVEATSLFMLEALAMGKTVVASDSEGLREVINESNGILVSPGDERSLAKAIMEAALGNDGENKRIEAVKTAERYPWSRIAELTEREYERLIKVRR